MSTAVSVPSWVTAVNAAPASLPQKNAEVMRRCAEDDTGRNSVSPCTMPRTTASSQPIGAPTVTATHGSAPRARQLLPLGWGREGFVSCGPVEQRRLGTSGLRVSRLALGTMTWGRDTDADEAGASLLAFLDAGGTLVDTADVYADGEAEAILGGLFADVIPRTEVVLATKAGARREDGPFGGGASRSSLLGSLDASLERMGTDYVDLWQLHSWDPDVPLDETLSAIDLAVSSGRVRYAGVANYAGWQVAAAARSAGLPLVSVQSEYSLLERGVEDEVLPAASYHGMGLLPWGPLGRGVLTGKYRDGT